ncbi:MAG: glycoside hydrolase family 16 protein [Bryobacteraceae bacterium]|nr:glycoside hydrolase family 16 protein [Bryobacteraceae bacterium]
MKRAVTGVGLLCLLISSCKPVSPPPAATIEITSVPPPELGSPDRLLRITGRVKGAPEDSKVVLFALSGVWWVQPTSNEPFTDVQTDLQWTNLTHPGSAYAALLVNTKYQPPPTAKELPQSGGNILAVAVAKGIPVASEAPRTIAFSGYEWTVRDVPSDRAGTNNEYSASNAWTDSKGFLHLRIDEAKDHWTSAELRLKRSLGYGLYRFVVRDISHLEPAAVFSIFTYDETGPPREMDIEISRWGESTGPNAQYIVQPYYVPANVVRFAAPHGMLTHTLNWQPGRVSFQTVRGASGSGTQLVDEHAFTSGIPSPKNESVHMNLYVFDNERNPLREKCEVVIENFEYLP